MNLKNITKKFRKKEIGLALGGGAVLGAAHIGIIRAIDEYQVPVKYISGTSIGSLVAALYAFGFKWQEMKDIALDLDWLDISGLSLSQYGILTNKKIGKLIDKHLGDAQFKDANIPLAIVATDITNAEKIILNEGKVSDAIMASTAIPGIFKPLEKGDQMLVDGGVLENVPVLSLQEMGAGYIIGVDLNATRSFEKPDNIIEVLINTVSMTLLNATKYQTEKSDLLIKPDLSEYNLYDTEQVADLIEKGYTESKEEIKKAFT